MIQDAIPQCPNCGATVQLGMQACPYCHTRFSGADDTPPVKTTAPSPAQPVKKQKATRKWHWYSNTKLVGFVTIVIIAAIFCGYYKLQDLKPLTKQKIHVEEVMNGSNDAVIGECAYIEVSKKRLKSTTQEEFKELCDYVDTLNYNWFAVKAGSQMGICFTGCDTDMPVYGILDNDGSLYKGIGFITKDEHGNYIYTEDTE